MNYNQLIEWAKEICNSLEEPFIPQTPLKALIPYAKVVLLAQDPYPNPSLSTGRAFQVPIGKMSASLKNILRLIGNPKDYNGLSSWEDQGVCLFNTALTTIPGKSNAHVKLWASFAKAYLQYLYCENPSLVVIALGSQAKRLVEKTIPSVKMLFTSHPSPLCRDRAFDSSDIFNKCNDLLKGLNSEPIDWTTCFSSKGGDIHEINNNKIFRSIS